VPGACSSAPAAGGDRLLHDWRKWPFRLQTDARIALSARRSAIGDDEELRDSGVNLGCKCMGLGDHAETGKHHDVERLHLRRKRSLRLRSAITHDAERPPAIRVVVFFAHRAAPKDLVADERLAQTAERRLRALVIGGVEDKPDELAACGT
jgi:hypothetical protein